MEWKFDICKRALVSLVKNSESSESLFLLLINATKRNANFLYFPALPFLRLNNPLEDQRYSHYSHSKAIRVTKPWYHHKQYYSNNTLIPPLWTTSNLYIIQSFNTRANSLIPGCSSGFLLDSSKGRSIPVGGFTMQIGYSSASDQSGSVDRDVAALTRGCANFYRTPARANRTEGARAYGTSAVR